MVMMCVYIQPSSKIWDVIFILKVYIAKWGFNMTFSLFRENISPLDQFEIRDLISLDAPILGYLHISITNIGLYLALSFLFIAIFKIMGTNNNRIISNK